MKTLDGWVAVRLTILEQGNSIAMDDLTGKPAPRFELPAADGKPYRLDDFRDGWLLLDFHRHLG